eukprot:5089518-Amphidinium_carterae.1
MQAAAWVSTLVVRSALSSLQSFCDFITASCFHVLSYRVGESEKMTPQPRHCVSTSVSEPVVYREQNA